MPTKIHMKTYLNYVCLTDEDSSQVDPIDLAHSLSLINRFNGHTKFPYSVAQHSLLGAKWMLESGESSTYALYFLLHDAHEAYLGDITRPVMKYFGQSMTSARREIEGKMARWQRVIIERFDLEPRAFSMEKVVETDERMLATEREFVLLDAGGRDYWSASEENLKNGRPLTSAQPGISQTYWPNTHDPLPISITETPWSKVKKDYLELLDYLYHQHCIAIKVNT